MLSVGGSLSRNCRFPSPPVMENREGVALTTPSLSPTLASFIFFRDLLAEKRENFSDNAPSFLFTTREIPRFRFTFKKYGRNLFQRRFVSPTPEHNNPRDSDTLHRFPFYHVKRNSTENILKNIGNIRNVCALSVDKEIGRCLSLAIFSIFWGGFIHNSIFYRWLIY